MDQLRHFLNSGLPTGKKSIKQYTLPGSNTLGKINNNFLHNKINIQSKLSNKILPQSNISMPNIHHQRVGHFIKMDRHSYNDAPGEVKRGGHFDASKVTPIYDDDAKKFIDQNAKSLISGTTLTPETKAQLDPYIKFGGTHKDVLGGTSRYVEGTGYRGGSAPPLSMNTIIEYRDRTPKASTGNAQTIDPMAGITTRVVSQAEQEAKVKAKTPIGITQIASAEVTEEQITMEAKARGIPTLTAAQIIASGKGITSLTDAYKSLQNKKTTATSPVAPGFFNSMSSASNLGQNIANAIGGSGSSGGSGKSSGGSSSGYNPTQQTTPVNKNIPNTTTPPKQEVKKEVVKQVVKQEVKKEAPKAEPPKQNIFQKAWNWVTKKK